MNTGIKNMLNYLVHNTDKLSNQQLEEIVKIYEASGGSNSIQPLDNSIFGVSPSSIVSAPSWLGAKIEGKKYPVIRIRTQGNNHIVLYRGAHYDAEYLPFFEGIIDLRAESYT